VRNPRWTTAPPSSESAAHPGEHAAHPGEASAHPGEAAAHPGEASAHPGEAAAQCEVGLAALQRADGPFLWRFLRRRKGERASASERGMEAERVDAHHRAGSSLTDAQ
jgi:hypothetical protein